MQYALRIEAVNLSNFIFDTNDLNTIRGGGLLLLHAAQDVERLSEVAEVKLEPITIGASAGIYSFEAGSADQAKKAVDRIRQFFDEDQVYRHATFVVDYIDANDEFQQTKEKLIALNRRRQMRQPTVTLRERGIPPEADEAKQLLRLDKKRIVCEIDLKRPIAGVVYTADGPTAISDAVRVRREYGQREKQQFYRNLLESDSLPETFSYSFEELATAKAKANRRLDGKMAVVYLDGNQFGKLQGELCKTAATQEEWDTKLRDARVSLMKKFFQTTETGREWKSTVKRAGKEETVFQLETLLWGGDEIIWVVPAWQGWWMLQFFYETMQNQLTVGKQTVPLSHAGGLVFCSHKAPIHRITSLTHDLAEIAKELYREKVPEPVKAEAGVGNLFAYEVLESFDHISQGLEEHRQTRCPRTDNPAEKSKSLVLDGRHMGTIASAIGWLKQWPFFPRRQLHQTIRAYLEGPEVGSKAQEQLTKSLRGCPGEEVALDHLHQLSKFSGGDDTRWFHLAQLWDYIPSPATLR